MNYIFKMKPALSLFVIAAAAVFFIFSGTVILSSAVKSQENTPAIPDSTVIQLPNQQVSRIENAANEAGLEIERRLTLPDNKTLVTLKGSPGAVKLALGSGPRAPLSFMETEKLETFPNYTYEPTKTPNDPKYSDQWNMDKVEAPKAWDITTGSTDTVIAIVDGGVLFNQDPYHDHSDMLDSQRWENSNEVLDGVDEDNNGYTDDKYGWDFTGGYAGSDDCPNTEDTTKDGDNDPQPYSCDNENDKGLLNKKHANGGCGPDVDGGGACYIGHGTIVGSIAAAATDNSTLVAGTDWNTKIMNLRVFDGYGRASTDRVVAAVEYATEEGADAINLSLAVYDQSTGSCDITDAALENALKKARNNDVIAAAASGNGNASHVCYPASSKHTLAVGASNDEDQRASFSNYGDALDLIAPGRNVPALTAPSKRNGNNEYLKGGDGTSLSTPHVAGTATVLKGLFPDATFEEVRTNLQKGVDKVPQMNGRTKTKKHGYGRLNLHKANRHANTPQPDGMLVSVKGKPHIYIIDDGKKRRIPNPATLNSHGFRWKSTKRATLSSINLPSGNLLSLREGTLIQAKNSTKVFIIDQQSTTRKRHIGSPSVFKQLGFKWKNVMKVRSNVLPDNNGPAVTSADQHPDGVLIKSSSKPHIYLVEDNQRRYVPSYAVLKSHRFRGGIKEAADDDMNLSNGSYLNLREGTLVKNDDPPIYVVNHTNSGTVEKRHIKTLFIYRLLEFGSSKLLKVSSNALPSQDGDPIN